MHADQSATDCPRHGLIDAKTRQVVWQGEIADALSLPVGNPVRATQDIDAAVAKLFAKYPPQSSRG
jgi:hypothetical protein